MHTSDDMDKILLICEWRTGICNKYLFYFDQRDVVRLSFAGDTSSSKKEEVKRLPGGKIKKKVSCFSLYLNHFLMDLTHSIQKHICKQVLWDKGQWHPCSKCDLLWSEDSVMYDCAYSGKELALLLLIGIIYMSILSCGCGLLIFHV